MNNFLFMVAILMASISATAQTNSYEDFPYYTEWQQKLIDNMFEYDGVYYSVLSEEDKTATVFDPHIFMFDSGGYNGDITVAENPIKDGIEYTTVEIANDCFMSSSVTSLVMPNSILTISDAVSALYELENLVISENVETIVSSFMFLTCENFEEYTVPESVKVLENSFNRLSSLKRITLPSHPLTLNDDFYNIPLEKIVCKSEVPYPLTDFTFRGVDKTACVVEVPQGCADAYKAADGWSEFANIIESEQVGISEVASQPKADGKAYRLDGSTFSESDKGIYIQNGKKHLKR